jgi:universal stress protein A
MRPKRILFCTDFSENSRPARGHAVEYAHAFGAKLLILHVINSSQIGYPSLEETVPADIREVLQKMQEPVDKALELIGGECRKTVGQVDVYSRIGIPANEIVRFAEEESVDLIVTGTHGWTGFRHLILGSTAGNVVRSAGCPVLTVRAPIEDATGSS